MKKIKLTLFALCCSITLVVGQTNMSISTPYPATPAWLAQDNLFFGEGDEAMSIKFKRDVTTIQKFDTKVPRLISTKEYAKGDAYPENTSCRQVMEFNKRYYLFYSVWDKETKIEKIFYKEINFKEGRFAEEGKFLFSLNKNKMGLVATGSGAVASYIHFINSYDDSKMLVYYKLMPEGKMDNKTIDVVGINVFDENLAPAWQQNITMPYTESRMDNFRISGPNLVLPDNNEYSIDGNGNVYIVATVFNTDKDFIKESGNDGKPNFHKELLTIKSNTSNLIITPISLEVKNINRALLAELPNHNMICAGYYNKSKELWDTDGAFVFNVENDGKLSNAKTFEIPLEILNQFVSEGEQKKNEKKENEGKAEFEDMYLQELHIEKDGSLLLIGEQAFDKTYKGKDQMLSTTTYKYDNILVTKLNVENKLAWMKKIPKQQIGECCLATMGYKYLFNEGTHYFLFNDNEKNENLQKDQEPEKYKSGTKGIFTAFKITDSNGDIRRESVFNTEEVKGIKIDRLELFRIIPTASNGIAFETYQKDKQAIMVKVALKK